MNDTITAREFLLNTFNTDFLTDEEKETIIKAMELYARGIAVQYADHLLIKAGVVPETGSIHPTAFVFYDKYIEDIKNNTTT